MDTHRIEVFNRANDYDVVHLIAHHLEFEFFPADHGALHQNFPHRTGAQAPFGIALELLTVIGDVAAGSPEGERGPHDRRKPDDLHRAQRVLP